MVDAGIRKKFFTGVAALALCLAAGSRDARADRFLFNEENDTFASYNDRNYTQGIRFGWLSDNFQTDPTLNAPFHLLSDSLGIVRDDASNRKRMIEWTIGQNIFTPEDIASPIPSNKDRPYAGWLYVGANLLQETEGHILENFEVMVGIVGPAAFGRVAQNDFHQYIGVDTAKGWAYQLRNEPDFMVSYEKRWRHGVDIPGTALAVDAIPELGITAGTLMTYAQFGSLFRFGHGLEADYGPDHIRPSLSGTAWFDHDKVNGYGTFGVLNWYMFVGAQARAIARNMFLDGSTFRLGPSISRRVAVADLVGGFSAIFSWPLKIDFSVTRRTKEFGAQKGADTFGMFTVSIGH